MSAASTTNSLDAPASRSALSIGWTISVVLALFLGSGGIRAWSASPQVLASTARLGYSQSLLHPLGTVELMCSILFLIPRTAALGAVLLTAYFGGAVASHIRIGDPTWPVPVAAGMLVWIALMLRMPRFHVIRPSRY